MMALPTTIDKTGVHYTTPTGTDEEIADLKKSYEHLCAMRQEIIDLGIVPAVEKWGEDNANL
jgi:malate dehydrogenase